jgi:hypothetical protein
LWWLSEREDILQRRGIGIHQLITPLRKGEGSLIAGALPERADILVPFRERTFCRGEGLEFTTHHPSPLAGEGWGEGLRVSRAEPISSTRITAA